LDFSAPSLENKQPTTPPPPPQKKKERKRHESSFTLSDSIKSSCYGTNHTKSVPLHLLQITGYQTTHPLLSSGRLEILFCMSQFHAILQSTLLIDNVQILFLKYHILFWPEFQKRQCRYVTFHKMAFHYLSKKEE